MDREQLEEVSIRSMLLKTFIKAPMILVISTSALQSGLTIVMLKLVTELGQSRDFTDHIGLVGLMIAIIAISGTI